MFRKPENKFFYISKRGRVAYLILCFEEALKFYDDANLEDWKWLLNELWEITSTWDIDGWVSRICYASPEAVMSYHSYQEIIEHCKSVTAWHVQYEFNEDEFISLQKLYSKERPYSPVIYALYDKILNVIILDWGDLEESHTPECLPAIDEAEQILSEHGIPFPQNSDTMAYIMKHKDRHYGPPFDGRKFSSILRNR